MCVCVCMYFFAFKKGDFSHKAKSCHTILGILGRRKPTNVHGCLLGDSTESKDRPKVEI